MDTNLLLPNDKNVTTYTDINIENKEENNTETTTITEETNSKNVPTLVSYSHTVVCVNDRLFDITKELFTKYNLSNKDISDIINQSDFNKITKAHKVLINYKKPINSFMGFLRDAILNNWEPDINSTTISTSSGTNDYYKRCGYSSWEELELAWQNRSAS